jgi:hypothetical protein
VRISAGVERLRQDLGLAGDYYNPAKLDITSPPGFARVSVRISMDLRLADENKRLRRENLRVASELKELKRQITDVSAKLDQYIGTTDHERAQYPVPKGQRRPSDMRNLSTTSDPTLLVCSITIFI